MLAHAVQLSKRTGRKVLVYPPSARIWDNDFGLSWLQLVDLDAVNAELHPRQRPCRIRGLNYGDPDPAVLQYVYNGTLRNRRPECAEVADDSPWQLRDPGAWSTDCYLLPWTFTAEIAAAITTSIPVVTTTRERGAHHFPGNGSCGKPPLDHARHLVESGPDTLPTIAALTDVLVLTTGDVMMCDPKHVPHVPVPNSPHIRSVAAAVVRGRTGPVLCVHARRTDLSLVPLQAYIDAANDAVNRSAVRDVIVITDAAQVELAQLRSGIAAERVEVGCDPDRYPACRHSADMRAAIEQQICAMSDLFVGSPQSTFTARVLQLRRYARHAANTSVVLE